MRVKIKLVDDRKLSNCQGFFRLCCLGANGATLEALDSIVFLSGLADGSFCFFIGAVYNSGGIGVVLIVIGVIVSICQFVFCLEESSGLSVHFFGKATDLVMELGGSL